MANKRRILTVTLLIAVLGGVSWLLLRPDPEPMYQGKPLTYWLDAGVNDTPPPSQADAIEAIEQIGTNAIPTLLRLLNTRDSKFKLKLIQLAQKQRFIKFKFRTDEIRDSEAQFGFIILRSKGKSAVPALLEIYNERRPGPYDHPPGASGDPVEIARIFTFMGPAAAEAVPALVQNTTETNYHIRRSAVWALGSIHSQADRALPALTRSLRDPDANVRGYAASSLAAFGTNAQSAVPELIKLLADPSSEVSSIAAIALKQIDPEAAAKAGVK